MATINFNVTLSGNLELAEVTCSGPSYTQRFTTAHGEWPYLAPGTYTVTATATATAHYASDSVTFRDDSDSHTFYLNIR